MSLAELGWRAQSAEQGIGLGLKQHHHILWNCWDELSEGSGFLSRELGQAHSCAAAFPPHLYLWAEPQPPHTFPSGSTAKLWDEFPSTGDLILFPPVLPSALPPPILQKAMPDWEHSIQQLPGGQEWFISAGDWTRLCLALVPRFRNNNVMNNPFMFIHLV